MPLPKPKPNEKQSAFIGRCMSSISGEFESQDQRLGVCYSQWRGKKDVTPVQVKCANADCKESFLIDEGAKEATCESCQTPLAITWETKTDSAKMESYGHDAPVATYVEEVPCGGAISFAEYDTFMEAQKQDAWAADQDYVFSKLFKNIMRQDPQEVALTDKLNQVKSLASEFGERVAKPEEYGYAERNDTILDKAKSWLLGNRHIAPKQDQSGFYVTKDLDGRWRWLAMHTNKYEDRDKEIFPEAAHKEYESYVDATHDYPELWLWHVPGSKMGQADFVAYSDGFMFSSGTFTYEAAQLGVPQKLKAMGPTLGVSHGFTYPKEKKKKRMYHQYRTREISPLPRSSAANPWTEFGVEVNGMSFEKSKRDFFVSVYGEQRTNELEKQAAAMSKDLTDAGIGWKEVMEALEPPETTEEALEAAPVLATANPEAPAERPPETTPVATATAEDAAPQAEGQKEPTLGDVVAAVNALAQGVQAFSDETKERLTALERSDDEKITELRTPAAAKAVAQVRPTQDENNVLPDGVVQKVLNGQRVEEPDEATPSSEKAAKPYIEDLVHLPIFSAQEAMNEAQG